MEIFQRDTVSSPKSAPTFAELFEINDLKAQVQEKDTVILKLREKLNSFSGDIKERKVDVAPLVPKLRKNKTAHSDYIRHTQEEAATLREILQSERLLSPLNTSLAYACKYTRRIQELLMILQQTCPSITDLGTKLVAVTPKNKTKQIRHTTQNTKSEKTTVATSPSANKDSNTPLEAKVLTRSSNSSKTSYAVAADLSELELKKILNEKMERNKSIHRSDEQRNLYKALVDAYKYRGSKRKRKGKEPESTSAPKEKASKTTGAADDQPIAKASQHPEWFKKQTKPPTPDHAWNKTLLATHGSIQPWISDLVKQADSRASFNELMDTPVDFSAFLMNWLNVDTLTLDLLAGPTYELIKESYKSLLYPHNLLKPLPLISNSRGHRVIPFDHFIKNDFEYLRGGASSRKYTTSVTKTKTVDYGHIKWIKDLFYGFAVNRESARDVYSKQRIIVVIELQIVEWHDYKHLDWISVRRDDDKLYKFKEGDFKRLHIQDIEDMLRLLVQGKLTNLTVEECFAFNVSLRMFTKSIVIQRRMEDLQLGVESYQKKLNLTKSDMYKTDLKCKESYIAYSNPEPELEGSTQGYPLVSVEVLRKIHTLAGNPVKEILLKLNLPNHRTLKDGGEGTCFQLSQRFIAVCSNPTIKYKDIMKAQVHVSRLSLLDA
nr:hypothetical protein [Tanacetum cinerariifolium]